MARISYVTPDRLADPELVVYMEHSQRFGTPRPETQAIRSHVPDVAKAFSPSSSDLGWSGIMFGVLYGVLIFVGFETAANLAEETADPKRAIPRAVLLSVAVVSVFYLIAAYAQVAGFGFDMTTIGNTIR